MATNTNLTEANNQAANKRKLRKGDLILLGMVAAMGLAIFIWYGIQMADRNRLNTPEAAYYVQVDVNNRTEALLPVDEDGEFTFKNIYSKGENVLHIQDGKVSMHSANCPDQVCVYQGEIEPPTIVPIVCMPNVVYVSIVERSEIDWSLIREELVPEELKDDYAAYQAAN